MGEFFNWLGRLITDLAGSLWLAAIAGRLAWHTRLVQKGARKSFFCWEITLELPIVLFTWIVGTGICERAGLSGHTAGAVMAVVSYFGPGGLQWLAQTYLKLTGKEAG